MAKAPSPAQLAARAKFTKMVKAGKGKVGKVARATGKMTKQKAAGL
jgi:hypothetical protein